METLKQQALANIEAYIKNSDKDLIIERLKQLSGKNSGGVKISEIFKGCFEAKPYFNYVSISELSSFTTERFNLSDILMPSIQISDHRPQEGYIYNKTQNPQKNAGFFICLFYG